MIMATHMVLRGSQAQTCYDDINFPRLFGTVGDNKEVRMTAIAASSTLNALFAVG